jgi:hypothetical protein
MTRLFDRYDGAALERLFAEAGVLDGLHAKGFRDCAVALLGDGLALPRVALSASKDGRSHLLLEARLGRISVPAPTGGAAEAPLDLLLVYWVREEDPTAEFTSTRPRLPLQRYPGLGMLRRVFRVALRIAGELGADGVASRAKFFHDAVIFWRSRLFLHLDGGEQGRFEALERDLAALSLRDASVAVAGWCVRDAQGRVVRWQPGYQVFPLSPRLTAHLHSPHYAEAVAAARAACHFRIDPDALAAARAQLAAAAVPDTEVRHA